MEPTEKAPSFVTAKKLATSDASNAIPVQTPVTPVVAEQTQKFFKPKAQLDAVGRKLRSFSIPRRWDEYERVFMYVRNTKWGVSTINGIAVDIGNHDHQFHKQEHIRTASWVEVAKKFNLDIRGENNQLWFREPIIDDKTGAFILDEQGNHTFRDALPVEGYSDESLSKPMENKKHWLEVVRPDLWRRWNEIVSSGGQVSLPPACTTDELKGVLATFEMDLGMAQNVLAASVVKM